MVLFGKAIDRTVMDVGHSLSRSRDGACRRVKGQSDDGPACGGSLISSLAQDCGWTRKQFVLKQVLDGGTRPKGC